MRQSRVLCLRFLHASGAIIATGSIVFIADKGIGLAILSLGFFVFILANRLFICVLCKKPMLEYYILGLPAAHLYPEKICSQCGFDLTSET